MTLLEKIFLPKETQQCLLILDEYALEFESLQEKSYSPLWYGATLQEAIGSVEQVLKKGSKEIIESVRTGNGTPRLIVVRTLYNTCKIKILSGSLNIHHGVLNDRGTHYYLILEECLKILKRLGELTKADIRIMLKEIDNSI